MKQGIAKVYAAFFPAGETALRAVEEAGAAALGTEPWLFLERDILRISWEGMYFPVDEALEALKRALPPDAQGKFDYLDLEEWTLTRHVFQPGAGGEAAFNAATRSLNHVLDYSGH